MPKTRPAIPHPTIMLVTDSTRRHARPAEGEQWVDDVVREAALGGVNAVQLREKQLATIPMIDLGLHVRDVCTDRALFFVNGDLDAARTLAADGVHLPEDGPSVPEARDRLGDRVLISRAVHSLDAALRAEDEGADIVQVGTVFATASKPGATPLGVGGLRTICTAVRIPVIAIGGITPDNAASVMAAGAVGVAVIGAIFDSEDPRAAAVALHRGVVSGMLR